MGIPFLQNEQEPIHSPESIFENLFLVPVVSKVKLKDVLLYFFDENLCYQPPHFTDYF